MYDIVGKRNRWFAISALLTIPGLIFIFLGGLKPSIDFTGGTVWEVRYASEPSADRDEGRAGGAGPSRRSSVHRAADGFLRIRTEPIGLLPPHCRSRRVRHRAEPSAGASSARPRRRGTAVAVRSPRRQRVGQPPARRPAPADRRHASPSRISHAVPTATPSRRPSPSPRAPSSPTLEDELEDRSASRRAAAASGPSARSSAPTSSAARQSSSSSASCSSSPTCGCASASASGRRRSSPCSTT